MERRWKRQVTIRSPKNANKGNFGVNSDVKKGQGQNIRKKKKLKPDSKSRLKNNTRKEKGYVFFKSVVKLKSSKEERSWVHLRKKDAKVV